VSKEEKYNEELKELRKGIEEVDDKIVELFNFTSLFIKK